MKRREFIKTLGIGAGAAAGGLALPFGGAAWASEGEPYRLGLLTALSGPASTLGRPMQVGAEIAIEQINANGGVNGRKLELIARDTRANPSDATVVARELVQDEGCNLLFGCVSSAVALAISAMLDRLDAALITTAAHTMRLTKEDFNQNYFRITDNPYMRQRALARIMAEEYGDVTQWSGLIPDHEYGRSTWQTFSAGLREFYPEVAGRDPQISDPILTEFGGADYRSYIATAMRNPAEGFLVSLYGGDAVTMFQQARPYGFYDKARAIVDTANEFIVARAMKENFPEMWVGSHWYFGAFEGNEINDRLYKRAVERTGDDWPMGFVSEAHSAVLAYAAAIEKAGTNETGAVVRALEGLTFETATGPRTIRAEDHQTIKPVILYKLRGAEAEPGFEVVEYRVVDGAEMIDPPTPGQALEI
ncbi:MAG: ABC transporter substrate-binding protein [Ectothiorhodospiraceae bacterium]|nr:ABC transporter substrate-binding protein [Ectothiorhodospiraceae bacterium]